MRIPVEGDEEWVEEVKDSGVQQRRWDQAWLRVEEALGPAGAGGG